MSEESLVVWIGRIRKALRREFEIRTEPMQITASQLQVLRRLWQGDGIVTSVLTQDAGSDGGTVTGVLDRLEKRGLIRRERSAKDRRAVLIWLTAEGHALEAPLTDIITELNQQALAGLSAEQQKHLLAALKIVGGNLDA